MTRAVRARHRMQAVAVVAMTCLVTMAGALPAGSQEPTPSVFTVAQARAGRALYAQRCASCHMADLSGGNDVPPLAGELFRSSWKTRTTQELLEYMTAAMPPAGPSLTPPDYASIASYIFETNGAKAGESELTAAFATPIGTLTPARPSSTITR